MKEEELDIDADLDSDLDDDIDADLDSDDSDPQRGGILQSTSKRVRMIFSVMASPNRIDILRILNSKGPLTYSELKSLKDVLNPSNGKCPFCGQKLSTSEFSLDVQER